GVFRERPPTPELRDQVATRHRPRERILGKDHPGNYHFDYGGNSPSSNSRAQRVVVITDHSCDLPDSVFALPEVDELSLTNRSVGIYFWLAEPVHSHLDRPIAVHGVDLKRPRNQLTLHLATDVLLYCGSEVFPAKG